MFNVEKLGWISSVLVMAGCGFWGLGLADTLVTPHPQAVSKTGTIFIAKPGVYTLFLQSSNTSSKTNFETRWVKEVPRSTKFPELKPEGDVPTPPLSLGTIELSPCRSDAQTYTYVTKGSGESVAAGLPLFDFKVRKSGTYRIFMPGASSGIAQYTIVRSQSDPANIAPFWSGLLFAVLAWSSSRLKASAGINTNAPKSTACS